MIRYFFSILEGFCATLQNVETTVEKQRELELLLHRSTQEGVWDLDLKSNILRLSPRLKEMLGYRDYELENSIDTIKNLMLPEDYTVSCKLADNHIRYNIPFHGIFRFWHKDGSLRYILSRAHIARGDYGEPIRMVGTHTDVTEQVLLKEKMAQYQTQLALLNRCLPGILCQFKSTTNEPFTITYISDKISDICGFSPEQLYENSAMILHIAHPDDREMLIRTAKNAISTWSAWSYQYRICHKEKICWLYVQFVPIKSTEDTIWWEGVILDINKFRQETIAENSLRRVR